MEWNSAEIEEKWKKIWIDSELYKIHTDPDKPKYYVLDMFPYPSGAGLHVGHPLGYIASDIFSRYKRLNGFNVLHPMGYDAFGLPAEQFAVQTGVHPAISTQANINSFRKQLDNLGFSFDCPGRSGPVIPPIINGRNGFSSRCTTPGMTRVKKNQKIFPSLSIILKIMELKVLIALATAHSNLQHQIGKIIPPRSNTMC